MNVAHNIAGLLNLHSKWNLVDHDRIGMAIEAGIIWVNPTLTWLLKIIDRELQDRLGDVDLLSVPFALHITLPVPDDLDLNLTVGYTHNAAFGTLNDDTLVFDGSIGTRQVFVEPSMRLYINQVVMVEFGVHIAVWAVALGTFTTETNVNQGVIAGVETTEWTDIGTERLFAWHAGIETQFGRTHLRLSLRGSPLARFLEAPVLPAFIIYWRW
jgi:hypothetical protein